MIKSVTVLGREIPIIYLSEEKMKEVYGGPAFGIWEAIKRVIYIREDLPKKEQHYVIFHEMGHALNTFTGMELVMESSYQEIMVQSFATLMEDLLKQKHKFR